MNVEMDLSALTTPLSWFIVELISVVLVLYVLSDITRKYKGNDIIVRIGEFLGFMLLVASYENIGHGANVYQYSQDRILMFGAVPLSIIFIEGVVLYAGFRFTDKMDMPWWTKGLIVGLFALFQDLTIDPSAVFDLQNVGGNMEGRWNWTQDYEGKVLFGIPFFNFSGWFLQNFYYTSFILIGRRIYENNDKSIRVAIAYIMISVVSCFLLIVTLNNVLLFMWPIFPQYTKVAEIIMLTTIVTISLVMFFKYFKIKEAFSIKNDKIIWLIPVVLHAYDILAALIIGIEIAYIPSILFAIPHGIFLWYIFKKSKVVSA